MAKKAKDSNWSIIVKTGDHKGSGSDANVSVAFYDKSGKRSENIKLDVAWRNDFKRGKEDSFPCDDLTNNNSLEMPCTMELWRDDSGVFSSSSWYCEVVILKTASDTKLHFPVLRWVECGVRYKIPVNDTSLPQDDPHPEQRKKEVELSKDKYKLLLANPGLPVQLENLPEEEKFSDDALRHIDQTKKGTLLGTIVGKLDFRKLSKFDHLERLFFVESSFPKPRVINFWKSDEWFGAQRLIGANPMTIKLCKEIPENFAITKELVEPFLEDLTLEEALNKKRLFIIDYHLLDGIIPRPGFYICAPLALFFVNSKKKLMPVAIQLFQDRSNTVFTPGIDNNKWTLVKMWFNFMDAAYQQSCFHLGFTHLAMEGVAVSAHRCLSKNHPIFRLLAPHFIYLMAIKNLALDRLTAEEGLLNKVMGAGVKGGFQLLSRLWKDWTIDVSCTLPAELNSRGVSDPSVLPEYPYRDDGMLVYDAIKKYVTDIANIYYDSDDKVSGDFELQEWGKLLATSAEQGGVGLKGIPNEGTFKKTDDIVLVCSAVIFTCSAQHAAVNFGQYEQYGFIPNYPSLLRGQPPTDTDPIKEEDVMNALGERATLYEGLALAKTLSKRGTNALGDWEVRWQYDPKAVEVENGFRNDLKSASEEIKKRNSERHEFYQYVVLDPENIPNAISI